MRLALIALANLLFVEAAFAAEGAAAAGGITDGALAAIGIGIAVFGGALGQSKVASAILDGISRNPGASGSMQTPFFIGMALIESLVIFGVCYCSICSRLIPRQIKSRKAVVERQPPFFVPVGGAWRRYLS